MTASDDTIIALDRVSLEYRLHTQQGNSLREWLVSRLSGRPYRSYRSLWALKDVRLTCRRGERLGVLGINGAGKTSLLRVIAGIYPPTEGTVTTRGRVVPLLELGLGFQYEMTGVENIVLAGVLLGRTRQEARLLAPEILDFADVTDFADVPVKYYSSGMAARLAFSIAMQTEPDILLLDEVFAVGDIQWVERAEERMKTLLDHAQVVVLASHNLGLLKQLCPRGVYLDHGRVRADGPIDEVVAAYEQQTAQSQTAIVDNRAHSAVRLTYDVDGPKLNVTAESIPLLGECWVGLFHPGGERDDHLAYRRVTIDAPRVSFAIGTSTHCEARLYRWTPQGESLEASVDILVNDGRTAPARLDDPPAGAASKRSAAAG